MLSSPALADIDGNGVLDVVIGGDMDFGQPLPPAAISGPSAATAPTSPVIPSACRRGDLVEPGHRRRRRRRRPRHRRGHRPQLRRQPRPALPLRHRRTLALAAARLAQGARREHHGVARPCRPRRRSRSRGRDDHRLGSRVLLRQQRHRALAALRAGALGEHLPRRCRHPRQPRHRQRRRRRHQRGRRGHGARARRARRATGRREATTAVYPPASPGSAPTHPRSRPSAARRSSRRTSSSTTATTAGARATARP